MVEEQMDSKEAVPDRGDQSRVDSQVGQVSCKGSDQGGQVHMEVLQLLSGMGLNFQV